MNINKLAKEIYEQNVKVGWWDDINRCILTTFQLISTELAEATEGERKNLMDDHLPHRIMAEVELADALVRVLDLGGRFGWEYESKTTENYLIRKCKTNAAMHLACNISLVDLVGAYHHCLYYRINIDHPLEKVRAITNAYSQLIDTIILTSELCNYDIESAMIEKLEYNKHRADHKRENRAKDDGKKF